MWQRLRDRLRREADLERELAAHLALEAEENRDAGLAPAEARAAARRALGNDAMIREDVRLSWRGAWLDRLLQDARHSLRAIRRSPVFAAVTILSLAIGIGASTSVFSVFNAIFLRAMPVHDPEQLRILNWTAGEHSPARTISGYFYSAGGRSSSGSFSFPLFRTIQNAPTGFSSVAGFASVSRINVRTGSTTLVADAQLVSGNFFDTLGLQPALGRTLSPADDSLGAPPAALLSWRLFQRLFAGDPSAIGTSVVIEQQPYTVAGILPPDFPGLSRTRPVDLYLPLARALELSPYFSFKPDFWWVEILGRLSPGRDDRQVRAAVDVVLAQVTHDFAATEKSDKKIDVPHALLLEAAAGKGALDTTNRNALLTLFAMVGIMLLVACANVANLLLARGSARAHELAVRLSLGAGRLRLIRHLLTESFLLALAGGAAGLLLARFGTAVLAGLLLRGEDSAVDLRPDLPVLAFALALSAATALLFGAIPAFRSTRVDPADCLRHGGVGRPLRQRLARILLTVQVAMAFVLVFGAGLFASTLVNLARVPLGFRTESTLLFYVNPARSGYKQQRLIDVYRRLQERLGAIPGVHFAAFSSQAPIAGSMSSQNITVPGYTPRPGEHTPNLYLLVSGGFLTRMGTPILLGRDLSSSDNETSPLVAVVNQTLAKHYFTGNPVGSEFSFGSRFTKPIRIVGVAADARSYSVRDDVKPTIYLAFAQYPERLSGMTFELRTVGSPLAYPNAVRRAVSQIDPALPVAEFRTQQQQIARTLAGERMFAFLSTFFSFVTLALAAIGIYGVFAYAVARRTAEFGIRMAIGATAGRLRWLVLRQSLVLVCLGIAIAAPAALAAAKLVRARLFGVEPADPATLIAAAAATILAAALASWIPARRAARLDPMSALRYE